MVLESLINPFRATKKPYHMLFFGALYASIAIFLSLWIFREEASMIVVFLTVMATIPLMYKTIKDEEAMEISLKDERSILKQHSKTLKFFIYTFLGFVIAFTIWFIFLPTETVQHLFSTQLLTINIINSKVTGNLIATNSISSSTILWNIISNNLKVMLFCIFFAFFYGAGAIFILTWNASVISAAIGTYIRNNLATSAHYIGFDKVASYFNIISSGVFRYMTHGIFEILAYFIAGLSGGLISVAIIKHNVGDKKFNKVLKDALILLAISIAIILFAGVVEVYFTANLF